MRLGSVDPPALIQCSYRVLQETCLSAIFNDGVMQRRFNLYHLRQDLRPHMMACRVVSSIARLAAARPAVKRARK